MSGSDSDEHYARHQHRKHKRRGSSSDSVRECKKKHKSHKRSSSDRHYDQKRRKLKEESKDYVRVKSEPRDRHEKKLTRSETRERDNYHRDSRSNDRSRHGSPDNVRTRPRNFEDTHNHDSSDESHRTGTHDKRVPESIKTDIEDLLILRVDKDRLCDYICRVTKKSVNRNVLGSMYEDAAKHHREVSRDRALALIQKVYDVESEGEAEQIFQELLIKKPPRKIKREPEEFEGSPVPVSREIKKEPKPEHRSRGKTGGSHSEGETTKKPKSAKTGVEKPNFGLSGKLAEDTNICNGVVVKYSEPPEARMPKKRWRLYPFKGDQGLPTLYIHRQSAYLLGRDRKVADIPIDHPSCSKQHAALQYRLVTYTRADGSTGKQIRLYLIDLESANGTYINNNKIEPKKYVELFEKDVIKFGFSSREYVLLHEHSKDDEESENET